MDKIRDLPNFRPNKKPAKKTVKEVIYYIVGIILSAIFIMPIVYMIATSTKSESAYAAGVGTLNMFLPDFAHLGTALENYKNVLLNYDIWKYALNSFIYAGFVIVLNILINGLAGYVMAKLKFPGKRLLSFMIIFLIVVPVETSIIPLYSIVTYAASLKTIDYIVEGMDRAKGAMIITSKPGEICAVLSEVFESGMTKIKAEGGYSNAEKTVIYFVVNRFQVPKMREIVHELDPEAYITISEVADVFAANQDKT